MRIFAGGALLSSTAALALGFACRARPAQKEAGPAPAPTSPTEPATDAADPGGSASVFLPRCTGEMERRILAANPLVSRDPAAVEDVREAAVGTCRGWSAIDDRRLGEALAECRSKPAYGPWVACIDDVIGPGSGTSGGGSLAGRGPIFDTGGANRPGAAEIVAVCRRMVQRQMACLRESGDLPGGDEPPPELAQRFLGSCERSLADRRAARKLDHALDACADVPCGEGGAEWTACVTARMLQD